MSIWSEFVNTYYTTVSSPNAPASVVTHLPDFGTNVLEVSPPRLGQNTTVVTLCITASSQDDVELWWPNGMGKQPLYDVFFGISNERNTGMTTSVHKRIGKRSEKMRGKHFH
jgi:hypothetical protein